MLGRKLRMYLAYWARSPSKNNPDLYHVGLLLTPKNPKVHAESSWKFHAINRADAATDSSVWVYVAEKCKPRTVRLTGVVHLGKIAPEHSAADIETILKAVVILALGDPQGTDWRCSNWIWEAIELLAEHEIIPPLPGSGRDVWDAGIEYIRSKTEHKGPVLGVKLYTCNTSGKNIDSEIGPMET